MFSIGSAAPACIALRDVLRAAPETGVQPARLAIPLGLAAGIAPAALAQDVGDRFSGEGAVEITMDRAAADSDEMDTLAATIEYAPSLRLTDRVTVQGQLTVETVEEASGDSAFAGMGAYAQTLNLQYAGDAFTLFAGKIDPPSGLAVSLVPGLFGDDVASSYELVEMLGVGGDVNLGALIDAGGEHVLTVAAFQADRSVLGGSLGADRPRLRLADGGLANTEGPESVAISLDGALDSGFGYSLGYRTLAAGQPGEADERGLILGVSQSIALGVYETEWLAEIASFENSGGAAGGEHTAITLAGSLRRDDWFGSIAASGWDANPAAGLGDLRLLEIGAGRDFEDGFTLDASIQAIEQDGADAVRIGARLTWAFG